MRRRAVSLGVAVLALALAGGAWAYLRTTGSGPGSGSVSVSRTVTIADGTGTVTTLIPGGTGDLRLSLANATSGSLHVNSLVLDTGRGTGGYSADAGTCLVTFSAQDNGGTGWNVAANSTLQITLTGAVSMGVGAPSACQGKSAIAVYLKAS